VWPFRKKVDPIDTFWMWFEERAGLLASHRGKPLGDLVRDLSQELQVVHPGLVVEVDLDPRRLAIGADGNRELFPLVLDVVGRAPSIAGWEIVAFKQAGAVDVVLKLGGHEISTADLWFSTLWHEGKLGLGVFARGCDETNHKLVRHAVTILLDVALGEYIAATSIDGIVMLHVDGDPASAGFRPFREIRSAFTGPGRAVAH